MSLALSGDIVVAADSAYFLQAFAKIGLIPDGGATWYLPRLIGWGRAMELSMLAERLPASEALDWGLINRVVPEAELQTEARAMARRLATGPKSLGLIRKAYWASWENDFNKQMQLEADLQTEAHASADNREGVAAFLEKRAPQFTGR
jgi:2-(1,2-epoxy-1,2-dihydrophenyl)acetyl-CoA isomerase